MASPLKVLVVDDVPTNLLVIKGYIRKIDDIEISDFIDPAAALSWCHTNTPDLILLDYLMPGIDGAEFIRRFRELPTSKDVPIVVVTGDESREALYKTLEAGANDFLRKPVDHDELVARVHNMLVLRTHYLKLTQLNVELEDANLELHRKNQDMKNLLSLESRQIDQLRLTEDLENANAQLSQKNADLLTLSQRLSRYLSPQIYDALFSGKGENSLQPQRKKLTILFADIVGFTEATDSMDPEDLASFLSAYFTEMSKIALGQGATIDKYMGDALMLFFGDPQSRGMQEDAISAVRTGLAMQKRLQRLRMEWRDAGIEKPFQMRVGINTGYCAVGNFGSEYRADYTIIGGQVNLASRLQGIARPGDVIISYETYAFVKDKFLCEAHEPVTVKGIAHPVQTYRVIGAYDEMEPEESVIWDERDGFKLVVNLDKLSEKDVEYVVSSLIQAATKADKRRQKT